MKIHLHQNDLPDSIDLGPLVAIDTETMGLVPHRDRLCLVQLSAGDGNCHLVQIPQEHDRKSPNLKTLLTNPEITKIFHFARFDVAVLLHHFGVTTTSIYCTKIASRLARTYVDRHGLRDLCKDLLGIDISKHEQTSDWGAPTLSEPQLKYAASDVLHLHRLKEALDPLLERENRTRLAQECFGFIGARAHMDLTSGYEFDIFLH